MKLRNKVILGFVSIAIIIFLLLCIYVACFFLSQTDIRTKVSGYVLDAKSKAPINTAQVVIINERFHDDSGFINYDEFLGSDTITVLTDSNGYFEATFKQSAFIDFSVTKNGYQRHEADGEFSRGTLKYEIQLHSNEERMK